MIVQNVEQAFGQRELWRRQCARNIMDCYALGMEALMESNVVGREELGVLTRLMVDGMTVVRTEEDEKGFYRIATTLCRECAKALEGSEKARLFLIYAAIFEDM
jgi:hypothetical protein